ncbi:glycerophosphodiester phosphodiesterase family protein [Longispora albida]|uniref:glycerophosphodiester phosphodiesterase family protein n=1 Tax=Longispora albida TaxID=203523 RepID=UPI00037B456C|nr:glycerophosphodiester phosphodiesterase family protein [Longispora albida]
MQHPFLGSDGPIAFAHRGGAAGGAENTLAAFERAIALGYDYLETDVHASADGVAVVFHDRDTTRLTGVRGSISTRKWSEISRLTVDGEPIPSLEELLAKWPHARLNIDVKSEAAIAPTVAAIDRAGAAGRCLLATFDSARLLRIRRAAPHIATSLTLREVAGLRYAGKKPAGGIAAQVPVRYGPLAIVTRRFVEAAHRHGVRVHVWTIDDATQIGELLDLGVDGIMTDRVEVLRDVYQERGLWKS